MAVKTKIDSYIDSGDISHPSLLLVKDAKAVILSESGQERDSVISGVVVHVIPGSVYKVGQRVSVLTSYCSPLKHKESITIIQD